MKRFAIILTLLASPAFADQTSVPSTEISARELQAIVDERSKAVAQRFEMEKDANSQRFEAQEKAVAAALAAAKEAVAKAESAAEKRFDSVNEFRAALKDQQITLIPRTEVDVRLKSLQAKLDDIEARLVQIVSRAEGSAQLWQAITVALGLGFAAMTAFIAYRRRTV
jgi:phosphopantetheinyl transferase (holo-ACP synthase)